LVRCVSVPSGTQEPPDAAGSALRLVHRGRRRLRGGPAPNARGRGGRRGALRVERVFGRFVLIAGPCVLEDDALNLEVARALARLSEELALPGVFKASFDKANRSRPGAARGPGLEAGLDQLRRVGGETGLPLLTDVHEP